MFVKKLLKVYRVKNWYYQLGLILIGFLLVSDLNFDIIKIILLGFMLMAFAHSFNDYCEKKEKQKYFTIPLVISLFMLILFNYLQILFSITALIIATLYSLKPIALREKPFLVTITNAISVPILFLLGYLYIPTFGSIGLIIMLLLFCFVMIGQILHEATHIKHDKKCKVVSTAALLGKQNTKYFCYIFLILPLLLTVMFFYLSIVKIIFLLSTIIFVILMLFKIKRENLSYSLRKMYVTSCIILGLVYILSFYI